MIRKIDENVKCQEEVCLIPRTCESIAKRLEPIRFQFDDDNYLFGLPASEYLI